jgi:hypothetical protein
MQEIGDMSCGATWDNEDLSVAEPDRRLAGLGRDDVAIQVGRPVGVLLVPEPTVELGDHVVAQVLHVAITGGPTEDHPALPTPGGESVRALDVTQVAHL